MAYLVDTSVLGRLANTADALYSTALQGTLALHSRGEALHVTAQNLIEFRNAATRPVTINGLGLSIAEAEAKAAIFEVDFPLVPDTPDIYPAWKRLVTVLGVIGKRVHDARLVAVCHVHRLTHLLTFNTAHFTTLAAYGPQVSVVDPANV